MHIYIYIYIGMPFKAQSGPAGCRGLSQHSQRLTVPVEGGYSSGVAMGSSKSDFPWQRPGSTLLPMVLSGSDSAQKGMSISQTFS